MRRWLEIRRQLPINRWIERRGVEKQEHGQLESLRKELEKFLEIFTSEAAGYPFKLEMERNYYRAAVNLMSSYGHGAPPQRQGPSDG